MFIMFIYDVSFMLLYVYLIAIIMIILLLFFIILDSHSIEYSSHYFVLYSVTSVIISHISLHLMSLPRRPLLYFDLLITSYSFSSITSISYQST